MKYLVVYEKSATGWSAYVPDLPGCVTTGKTLDETKRLMREAVGFHLESMQLHDELIPEPSTECGFVEVTNA